MELPSILLAVVAIAVAVALYARVQSLTDEIRRLNNEHALNSKLLQSLTQRVYSLERTGPDADAAHARSAPGTEEPGIPPEAQPASASPASQTSAPPLPSTPPPLPAVPAETLAPSAKAPREDWEVIIGGNWLLKLGMLILVVGIAFFLSYSLTQLGPVGKVTIGWVVGLAMLGMGVAIEKKPAWRIFSNALIGGGWAALYFTTYAMHGIEAARVIESPVVGLAALLAVSTLMIVYSFRYRSEAITSLSYAIAYASLNLTSLTTFSVVAAVVLAGTLVAIATHFRWFALAASGIILTYGTFIFRYDPVIYKVPGILNGQAVLWIYWLIFEGFDLADLRTRKSRATWRELLYLLNAAGFMLASFVHGSEMHRQYWAGLFLVAAVAFAASSACRAYLLPNRDEDFDVVNAGYWGPSALASLSLAAAAIEYFNGTAIGYALLGVPAVIVGAGYALERRFLKGLGAVMMAFPFVHVITVDVQSSGTASFLGHNFADWTPLALLTAIALYACRLFAPWPWLASAAGSILLAAVIHQELPSSWATVAWTFLMLGILAAGIQRAAAEFRWQAYLLGAACFFRALIVNLEDHDSARKILTTSLVVLGFYAAQFLLRHWKLKPDPWAAVVFSIEGTGLLTALLFAEVQGRVLSVALGVEGIALLLAGFVLKERPFRISGLLIFLLCIAKLFTYDLRTLDTPSRILSFIILGAMMVAASWVYTRFREQIRRLL